MDEGSSLKNDDDSSLASPRRPSAHRTSTCSPRRSWRRTPLGNRSWCSCNSTSARAPSPWSKN